MKKIISILVALGLVLSLTVMATPVSADVTKADVVVATTNCAGNMGTYNITFNVTGDLIIGTTTVTITFPAGTVLPAVFNSSTNYIQVGNALAGIAIVPTSWITVAGQSVTFYSPIHVVALTDPVVWVFFNKSAGPPAEGIVNPAAGTYTLDVSTSAPVDVTPVKSNPYDIAPAISAYKFVLDFSPTYAGLAEDFIPPFKACGQVGYGNETEPGKWFTVFNMTLMTDGLVGCAGYTNVTINFELVDAPTGGQATLGLFDGVATWYWWVLELTADPATAKGTWGPSGGFPLPAAYEVTTPGQIHFNVPGDYEICLNVLSATAPICLPPGSEVIVERCMEAEVKQWKDVYSLNLTRKWNLISLPLVPFVTDVDAMLAALPAGVAADIISIWHYDRCSDKWYVKGATNSFETLTDIEDGKAYWIRTVYNSTHAAGTPLGTLWVWGNAAPMPPDGPSAYEVCEGWNMVGYRSPWVAGFPVQEWDHVYLWNFWPMGFSQYGMIYWWDATTQGWLFNTPTNVWMTPGDGYWIPFSVDGYIYP